MKILVPNNSSFYSLLQNWLQIEQKVQGIQIFDPETHQKFKKLQTISKSLDNSQKSQ
jgi:hypothetical protein